MLIFFNRTVTWQPPPGPGAAWIPGRRYWSGPRRADDFRVKLVTGPGSSY